ncbi:MAG TPA: DUF202 domain-containing protein [Thermoanaerobaculia bacterium]|nr:DUF202 domain-containing protein [Thermoanaerobaculia bacterium]
MGGDKQDLAEHRTEWAQDRTDWAMSRTILAVERTYTAWLKTAIAFLAGGVALAKLGEADFQGPWGIAILFCAMTLVAGAAAITGYATYWYRRRITDLETDGQDRWPGWVILSISGALLLVCLSGLIWIWIL